MKPKALFLLEALALMVFYQGCNPVLQPIKPLDNFVVEQVVSGADATNTCETLAVGGDSIYCAKRAGYRVNRYTLTQPMKAYNYAYVPPPVPFKPNNVEARVVPPRGSAELPESTPATYPWLEAFNADSVFVSSYVNAPVYFLSSLYRIVLDLAMPNSPKEYDPPKTFNPRIVEPPSARVLYPKEFSFKEGEQPINPQGISINASNKTYMVSMQEHKVLGGDNFDFKVVLGRGRGYQDGPASVAKFEYPRVVEVDDFGNVYILEADKHRVRKIDTAGTVSTLAGGLEPGYRDATGSEARFNSPFDIAVNKNGEVFVADTGNHRIRMITSEGKVTTVIGTGDRGSSEGALMKVKAGSPMGIDFGPDGILYYIAEGRIFRAKVPAQ